MSKWRLVFGSVINPLSDDQCDYYPKGALLLEQDQDNNYKIINIGSEEENWVSQYKLLSETEVLNFQGSLICPSFFDVHFHWVQDDVRLKSKDSLMAWLSNYAWPCETHFADPKYCEQKASIFFPKLAKLGTLGGAVYSSLHAPALESAMKHAIGDFIIGNVLMDMNSPENLSQTSEDAVSLLKKFALTYRERYVVTPRFAPTTSPEVMKKGVELALDNNCFLQSHLSENKGEIDYVLSLYKNIPGFEDVTSYTEIYNRVGFLTSKTIMAHAIHLNHEEYKMLSETKTALAHCPTSNAPTREKGLGSGLFNYQIAEHYNILWALGSDIGGGPFASMWHVIRSFVSQHKRAHRKVSYIKGLYRATLAGASVLHMAPQTGNLLPGKWANFLVVETPKIDASSFESPESILEVIIKSKAQRESFDDGESAVFYKGHLVSEK